MLWIAGRLSALERLSIASYLANGHVVDRMKNWAHCGHITLARGERSRLADYAAETL